MSIPNDGGWGKSHGIAQSEVGQGKGDLLGHISNISKDMVILACLLLTASLCFGLGLLVNRQIAPSKDSLWIEQLPAEVLTGKAGTSTTPVVPTTPAGLPGPELAAQPAAAAAALSGAKNYVASKTGSKYYLPTCATAKRIKEENKVWFATKQQAEAKGYEPSSTCKGI